MLCSKDRCTGCGACSAISEKTIKMLENEADFLLPILMKQFVETIED